MDKEITEYELLRQINVSVRELGELYKLHKSVYDSELKSEDFPSLSEINGQLDVNKQAQNALKLIDFYERAFQNSPALPLAQDIRAYLEIFVEQGLNYMSLGLEEFVKKNDGGSQN